MDVKPNLTPPSPNKLARIAGVLFVNTFITAIPASPGTCIAST